MSIEIRCGGWWLTTVAAWGDLTWSHNADGGCEQASWTMDLPPTFTHTALTRGQVVEIKTGPWNLWKGILTEPNYDDNWTFTAQGLSALGKDYLCLDGSGNSTSTPNTAIDQAAARGLPWARSGSISSSAFVSGDTTDTLEYVGDLMDAWSTSVGKRWGVDAAGTVYANTDPMVPTWVLAPGTGRLGLADDDYASDIYIRYLTTGAGYATATTGDSTARFQFGRREYGVDATSLGLMNNTQATALGTSLLVKGKARQGYTNGVTASKYQLTTPGGTPAYLPFVVAGDLVRMYGVLNEQGQPLPYVDWVIGQTSYDAGSDTIGLTPVGLVARTLADVLSVTGSAA